MLEEFVVLLVILLCFGLFIVAPFVVLILLPMYWLIRKDRIRVGGVMVIIGGVAFYLAMLKTVLRWSWVP